MGGKGEERGEDLYLMVSVRLGRMASTVVGDCQLRVSLLNILYCASLIRSCSRCSSTYTATCQMPQRPILVDLGWMRLCSLWLVLQAENTDGVSAMPSVDSTRLDNLVLEITGWSCKFVRNHSADGAFWTGHAGCCV